MKTCPFCAEEILDAAIRCKHCRSDLAPAAAPQPGRPPRMLRLLLAGVSALALLAVGAPVLARPILSRFHHASGGCEPSTWTEWHTAMQQQCLMPSYVCENMTTSRLLADPDVARAFHEAPTDHVGHLADLVGRMRQAYGCSPEAGASFHPPPIAPPIAPPAFPPQQPREQTL